MGRWLLCCGGSRHKGHAATKDDNDGLLNGHHGDGQELRVQSATDPRRSSSVVSASQGWQLVAEGGGADSGGKGTALVAVGELLNGSNGTSVYRGVAFRRPENGGALAVAVHITDVASAGVAGNGRDEHNGSASSGGDFEVATSIEKIRLARELGKHPNLVAFVGELRCSVGGQVAFATELMMGGTLSSHLRHNGDLPQHECLGILAGIAAALDYLSTRGVAHRDVCADAVLLGLDPGRTARLTLPETRIVHPTSFFVGGGVTLLARWAAPEVLRLGAFSPAADVWSFGVLCYEAFTRAALPYEGLSNVEAHDQIDGGIGVALDRTLIESVSIVQGCFEFEPSRRPLPSELCTALASAMASCAPEGLSDEQESKRTEGDAAVSPEALEADGDGKDDGNDDEGSRSGVGAEDAPPDRFLSAESHTSEVEASSQTDANADAFDSGNGQGDGGGGGDRRGGRDGYSGGEDGDDITHHPVAVSPEQVSELAEKVRITVELLSLGQDAGAAAAESTASTSLPLPRPRGVDGDVVAISDAELNALWDRASAWMPGNSLDSTLAPAEVWTPATLTECLARAVIERADLLVESAREHRRQEQLMAVARWYFSVLSSGVPHAITLRVGDACGCVASPAGRSDGSSGAVDQLYAVCEPVVSGDGGDDRRKDRKGGNAGTVAFAVASSGDFGVTGCCKKTIVFGGDTMRVRNNLQAEVTLVNKNDGTASIYSLVFPDVVLRGLCAGAVTLHLGGRGTIRLRDAEENTALELVFGARRRLPGKRGDVSAVSGSLVIRGATVADVVVSGPSVQDVSLRNTTGSSSAARLYPPLPSTSEILCVSAAMSSAFGSDNERVWRELEESLRRALREPFASMHPERTPSGATVMRLGSALSESALVARVREAAADPASVASPTSPTAFGGPTHVFTVARDGGVAAALPSIHRALSASSGTSEGDTRVPDLYPSPASERMVADALHRIRNGRRKQTHEASYVAMRRGSAAVGRATGLSQRPAGTLAMRPTTAASITSTV